MDRIERIVIHSRKFEGSDAAAAVVDRKKRTAGKRKETRTEGRDETRTAGIGMAALLRCILAHSNTCAECTEVFAGGPAHLKSDVADFHRGLVHVAPKQHMAVFVLHRDCSALLGGTRVEWSPVQVTPRAQRRCWLLVGQGHVRVAQLMKVHPPCAS